MKKPLITLACICALALPAIGLAGNSGDGSEYGTQPGFAVATDNTACSGAGAFGYFGKDNNLGIKSDPTDPGANGQATGDANSEKGCQSAASDSARPARTDPTSNPH